MFARKKSITYSQPRGIMSKENEEALLDHAWVLYNNLKDSNYSGLVEAAYFFATYYNFDTDELPYKLFDAVDKKMKKDAEESNDEPPEGHLN